MDAESDTLDDRPAVETIASLCQPNELPDCWTHSMSDPQMIAVLAALGHQVRLSLWRLLLPLGEGGLAAGALAAHMEILPSTLSFHLRIMTQAGVLMQRRSSRHIIYAVNVDLIARLAELLSTLTPTRGMDAEQIAGLSGDC